MNTFITIALCFAFFAFGVIAMYVFISVRVLRIQQGKAQTAKCKYPTKSASAAKYKLKMKKIGTMDLILIIIGAFLLVFTVYMIVLFREFGMVPDTLITCVFAALAGECGIMGWIKTTKDRKQERKWELDDRKDMRDDE